MPSASGIEQQYELRTTYHVHTPCTYRSYYPTVHCLCMKQQCSVHTVLPLSQIIVLFGIDGLAGQQTLVVLYCVYVCVVMGGGGGGVDSCTCLHSIIA